MKSFVLATVVGLTFSLSANAFSGWSNRKGYWITPKVPQKEARALKSGEVTTVEGEVCLTKVRNRFKARCEQVRDKRIEFRAYFPDEVTEVTDQVNFVKNRKSFRYSYTTPTLEKDAPNTFIIVLGKTHDRARHLLRIRAKLERRIFFLKWRLQWLIRKGKSEKRISVVENFVTALESTLAEVNAAIDDDPLLLMVNRHI